MRNARMSVGALFLYEFPILRDEQPLLEAGWKGLASAPMDVATLGPLFTKLPLCEKIHVQKFLS